MKFELNEYKNVLMDKEFLLFTLTLIPPHVLSASSVLCEV